MYELHLTSLYLKFFFFFWGGYFHALALQSIIEQRGFKLDILALFTNVWGAFDITVQCYFVVMK